MWKYILKKILLAVPVLLGITIIDYAIMSLAGSPLEMMAGPRMTEAGLALGFTRWQTARFIVAPQALRNVMPVYKGQVITLIKGTSIVGYIAIQDLTRAGDIIRTRTFDAFFPLLVVTVLYFLLAWLIGKVLDLAVAPHDTRRRTTKAAMRAATTNPNTTIQ